MKERRHVTIDKKIEEQIDLRRQVISIIFSCASEDSAMYKKAKRMENELNHLEDLIAYISRFEEEELYLSQYDDDCRFYEISCITVEELKQKLKKAEADKDPYESFPICLSLKKSKGFNAKAYVNIFEFSYSNDFENDYCLEEIEDILTSKDFLYGEKILTAKDWDDIVDEYRLKNHQGKTALINVSFKEQLI